MHIDIVAASILGFWVGVANADVEEFICRSKGRILASRATTGLPVSGSMGLLAILCRSLIFSPGLYITLCRLLVQSLDCGSEVSSIGKPIISRTCKGHGACAMFVQVQAVTVRMKDHIQVDVMKVKQELCSSFS